MESYCQCIVVIVWLTILPVHTFPVALPESPCDNTRQDGCRCTGLSCCCIGGIDETPKNLSKSLTKLIMKRVGITEIRGNDFQLYPYLAHVEIIQAPKLIAVDAEAFAPLTRLKKLSITDCPRLKRTDGYFIRNNRELLTLEIKRTALTKIPKMKMVTSSLAPPNVDFSENEISVIETSDVENVFLSVLRLSRNRIKHIANFAFKNSKIFLLSLDNNPLTEIAEKAFAGISALTKLDLSYTRVRSLPEEGLGHVEELSVEHVPTLKQLPPLVVFMNLKVARLTYHYHCCLFKYAATSRKNWKLDAKKYEGNLQELREKYCFTASPASSTTAAVSPGTVPNARTSAASMPTGSNDSLVDSNDDAGSGSHWMHNQRQPSRNRRHDQNSLGQFGAFYDDEEYAFDSDDELQNDASAWISSMENYPDTDGFLWGPPPANVKDSKQKVVGHDGGGRISPGPLHGVVWEPEPVSVPRVVVPCVDGDRSVNEYYASVKCSPQPDPLNPCEDVMIGWHLRILIFFVWIAAIAGNVLVILLLVLTNQPRQRVNNFLMINLAFADLCTGVYLAMLAVEDVTTRGEYYNYAVQWQTGWGCKIAGTLTVFASELSIVTMVIISFEVWYNTKHAIFQKRLQLSAACPLVLAGWLFAAAMAALPLLGVSDYSVTSTCLPLRMETVADRAYLVLCLGFNVLGFAFIVYNYISVYCAVARSMAATAHAQDVALAKLMFCLIFTDFLCWAPTVFFGLTAAARVPLISISVAKVFLVVFYPLNAFANPWIYVFLTKRFRMNVARFVRKHVWLHEFISNVLRRHQSHVSATGSNNYFYHSQPHIVTQITNLTSQRSSPSTCSSALVTPRGSKASLPPSISTSTDVTPRSSSAGSCSELLMANEASSLLLQSCPNSTTPNGVNSNVVVMARRKSTAKFRPQMSDIIENSNSNSTEEDAQQKHSHPPRESRTSAGSIYESLSTLIARKRGSRRCTNGDGENADLPLRSYGDIHKSKTDTTNGLDRTVQDYSHLYFPHPSFKMDSAEENAGDTTTALLMVPDSTRLDSNCGDAIKESTLTFF